MSSNLQIQAKALGDPTRNAIFQYLLEASGPTGVAELTGHLGLNHNAIRQHLAQLVDAELVLEAVAAPGGRGRPPLNYVVAPSAGNRWGGVGPYERLSHWLAEIVSSGDSPYEVGRRIGRRGATDSSGTSDPVAALVGQMARNGFEPSVQTDGSEVEIHLATCPFESTALADPGTVCELHRGFASGLAESFGGLVVDELVVKDPREADCVIRGRVEAAQASPPPER